MFKRVLIPLDGSEFAETVLDFLPSVIDPARAELVLLGVAEVRHYTNASYEYAPMRALVDVRADYEVYLLKLQERLVGRGFKVQTQVVDGDAADQIIRTSEDNRCDLIAITTHGRSGILRWTMGSVAERVIHGSTLPVLLVRSSTAKIGSKIEHVLVSLDGSALAEKALPYALSVAKENQAELNLLQVISPADIQYAISRLPTTKELDRAYERRYTLSETYMAHVAHEQVAKVVPFTTKIVLGEPANMIVAATEQGAADLLVICTHGYAGLDLWVHGSVANHVIRHAACPVLVVRGLETVKVEEKAEETKRVELPKGVRVAEPVHA